MNEHVKEIRTFNVHVIMMIVIRRYIFARSYLTQQMYNIYYHNKNKRKEYKTWKERKKNKLFFWRVVKQLHKFGFLPLESLYYSS